MQNPSLLEEELSRDAYQALQNNRAGMFIFQVGWIMAFICLVLVNWQLRFSGNWMSDDTQEASLLLGTVATLALIASTFTVRNASLAVKQDDQRTFIQHLLGTLALGSVFVLIIAYEWITLPQSGTQYGQVFRLMTGFHMVHAVVIGVYLLNVYQNGKHGIYGAGHFWAVEAGAKLWYFVLVAWLLFYVVIYWV